MQSVQHVIIGREINPCFMHDSVLMLVLILLVSLKNNTTGAVCENFKLKKNWVNCIWYQVFLKNYLTADYFVVSFCFKRKKGYYQGHG